MIKPNPYYEYRAVDGEFYEEHLRDFLPREMFDFHVHLTLEEHMRPISEERIKASWAMEVARVLSYETLRAVYDELFPRQEVEQLCFPFPIRETKLEQANGYIRDLIAAGKTAGLYTSDPAEDPGLLREQLVGGGFSGIKPYPDLAGDRQSDDLSVFDFVPHEHLRVLDDLGMVVLLHLPRKNRLRDPRNIEEIKELVRRYPRVRLVVAHLGRSYCTSFAAEGLPALRECGGVYYDLSAVLNPEVLKIAFEEVGAERLLFGSDFPITTVRGKQEWRGDQYVNFSDVAYSWNKERKPPEEEAKYTFFIYEACLALKRAGEDFGLSREDFENIFCRNAKRLLGNVGK